jgi:hypothetical protein
MILLLFVVAGVVPVVLALAIYGYYMVDRTSPDEDVLSYTDTYTRDHTKEAKTMKVNNKQVMMIGKVVLGKRVGMDTPMVRSNRMSDHLKVEAVVPVIEIPQQHPRDTDPWMYMRIVQQWKQVGDRHE